MIIPLKDSIPAMRASYATSLIMLASAAVFLYQETLSPAELCGFVATYGLVPANLPFSGLTGLLTYTFLHGGWLHLIGNVWIFRIFADNIEDVMGPLRFAAFYILCGVAAGIAHTLAEPGSPVPVVGGSGAISGVLGAYFLLYPHARVTTLVFLVVVDLPAVLYLGGWFFFQLYSGFKTAGAGVAWWAHLGGFVAGMLLFPLFRANRPWAGSLPEPPPPRHAPDPRDPWAHLRSK